MEHADRSYQFPETRRGMTRKFTVAGHEVYLTVNLLPDGQPGEVFVKIAKQGSTLSGLMQAFAVTVSAALQRGVPWNELRDKYVEMRFDPWDDDYASLIDGVARNVDELVAETRERHSSQMRLDFHNGDAP